MKTSHKIWLIVSGILLIALGVLCICKPGATLFAMAWMIGCFTLFSGISKVVFTFQTQKFMPNSGTRMLSGLFQIILGILFLTHNIFVAMSLPLAFVLWVMVEGTIIFIQSFDYKKVGFQQWWVLLLLGIVIFVLGVLGLRYIDVAAETLTWMIGIGIIVIGLAYLLAYTGIHRFEKEVKGMRNAINEAVNEASNA